MAPDYDWLYSRTRSGKDRNPERARQLLTLLDHPERGMKVLHVIGTNGKGSVCAMLEAGFYGAGFTVGRFTSPHLTHFGERIRVDLQEIPEAEIHTFIEWAKVHAPEMPFFELTLGMALQHFQRKGVEWAIIEAGVGGKQDATNALSHITATLITNVGLDHQATLGNTLREIAKDKAGAIRPGVPVLTTATGEGLSVIKQVAEDQGAEVFTPKNHPHLFVLPRAPKMRGSHQISNAWLTLATFRLLAFQGHPMRHARFARRNTHLLHLEEKVGSHWPEYRRIERMLDPVFERALDAQHPGRLETFKVEGKTIILDGAHNPHAARAVAQNFKQVSTLLFGIMARKDVQETLATLAPLAEKRVYTCPGELGMDPQELAQLHPGEVVQDPLEALQIALDLTPQQGCLLVAGSLYLIGRIRPKVLDMVSAAGLR